MVGKFVCNTCSKEYKTKRGLTRHINTHHDQAPSPSNKEITLDQLSELMQDVQVSLGANKNYAENTRLVIRNIVIDEIGFTKLHGDIALYEKLDDTSNAEHFISMFYGYIIRNVTAYITSIAPQVGTLLLKKVGDNIPPLQKIGNTDFIR